MTVPQTADSRVQERVFAFLADPARHGEVHRIDTHAASVFLADGRALKIKRAVRFPYLDYSTLAKRKAACEDELKVNRPFAPQIYRRVVPITEDADGSLNIDGNGTPVEYAVEMTRFDERQTLDHLAEAAPPDPDLVSAIADAIATSHVAAAPAAAEPWIGSILPIVADDSEAFRASGCLPAGEIDRLDRASRAAFSAVRDQLGRRGGRGLVRRCHGDLHLGNIVLIEGKPVLFDAIEFDPLIASVDVFYDLAFPMMDFLRYGRPAAANGLLNGYLDATSTDHIDALAALPLFMSLRAAIRAKVLLARLGWTTYDKAAAVKQRARGYFELAQHLIHPPPPMLVAVGGLSGTGKSVLARALAPDIMPEPGAVVLRTDVLRKQLFKVCEEDRLPESAYEPEVTRQVYEMVAQRAEQTLIHGHSVIVDAVFARASERAGIQDVAATLNIRFVGLFLVADLAIRLRRVGARKNDASDATAAVAQFQEGYDLGAIDWTMVDAAGTPEQTLQRCQASVSVDPEPARENAIGRPST
jgi:uncharacterized protein